MYIRLKFPVDERVYVVELQERLDLSRGLKRNFKCHLR